MKAVFSIYLLLVVTAVYSQAVNQHYYQGKSEEYLAQKKLKLAEQYADSALMVAVNTNDYDSLTSAYQLHLIVHGIKGDYESSLADARMIIAYRDSAILLRQGKAKTERDFIQQKEKEAHEMELASLRDLIANLEENKTKARENLYIVLTGFIVLSLIAFVVLMKKRRQAHEAILQAKFQFQRQKTYKETISHLLTSNLNDSLSLFENTSKSLANQFTSMEKDESIELLGRLQSAATNLKVKLSNVVQWVEYQADSKFADPVNMESKILVEKVITRLKPEMTEKRITENVFMPEGQIIFADRQMIEIVLNNLTAQAIQHTPEGGTITFFSGRKDGLITIGVRDAGPGMSEETLSKLFTSSIADWNDQKGKDLELLLSKELVERNGGRMYVESKVGEGSNFYFSLPEGSKF